MANIGQLIPLPPPTAAYKGYTHILRLTYLDANQLTSTTAQAVVPGNTLAAATRTNPANQVVHKALAVCVTPFVGSSTTGLTVSLGDAGSSTRFVNAFEVCGSTPTDKGVLVASGYHYNVADTIDAIFTITGGTMAGLTAGQVDIYLDMVNVADLRLVVEPNNL